MILYSLYLALIRSICLFGFILLLMTVYICPSFFTLSLTYNEPMLGDRCEFNFFEFDTLLSRKKNYTTI